MKPLPIPEFVDGRQTIQALDEDVKAIDLLDGITRPHSWASANLLIMESMRRDGVFRNSVRTLQCYIYHCEFVLECTCQKNRCRQAVASPSGGRTLRTTM
jgi:hypothetical protein